MKKLIRLLNTVRYLKFSQFFFQIKNRLVKPKRTSCRVPENITFKGLRIANDLLDLDAEYLSRFDADEICKGKITLLHASEQIDGTFNCKDESHLWNFNLHYFEYAVALAAAYTRTADKKYADAFESLYGRWLNLPDSGDKQHPYTVSLRVKNLMIALDLFGDAVSDGFKATVVRSIYRQYRFLIKNTERHLLGNHYFENINSALICAVQFDEKEEIARFTKALVKECREQILPDGVHFERSMMYHKLILEDLIRTVSLMRDAALSAGVLEEYLAAMTTALYSLEKGCSRTLLFNDSGDNVAKPTRALLDAAERITAAREEKTAFADAGYYKLYCGNSALVFDCGELGPKYLAGHAHCDALSYELFVNGAPVIVNSGTGQYQGGLRPYFRSTAAHNTVVVSSLEQSQLWGEHRAAKRIHSVRANADENRVCGSFVSADGYFHERAITADADGYTVTDRVKCKKADTLDSFLHIPDDFSFERRDGRFAVKSESGTAVYIEPFGCEGEIVDDGYFYAPEFGDIRQASVLRLRATDNTQPFGYKIRL